MHVLSYCHGRHNKGKYKKGGHMPPPQPNPTPPPPRGEHSHTKRDHAIIGSRIKITILRHSMKASFLLHGDIFLLLILGDTFVGKTYRLSVVNTPNDTKICNFYSLRKQPTIFDVTTSTGLIPREYRTSGATSTENVHYPDLGSWWCFWLVVSREKFASTNQKHYPDLGSDTSFCSRFSTDVGCLPFTWANRLVHGLGK